MVQVTADLQVHDGVTARPLSVDDFKTSATGDATEITLAMVLTELQSVLAKLQGVLDVAGTVSVTNLPTIQQVSGAVTISDGAGPVTIDGTVVVTNPTSNPETGLAKDTTVGLRFSGGKITKTAQVVTPGNTTIHTPASGKAIKLFWVSALNDPDQSASPLIIFKFGANEIYRGYALAHWEVFTGAVDQSLVVNLDSTGDVAVTIHYQEV